MHLSQQTLTCLSTMAVWSSASASVDGAWFWRTQLLGRPRSVKADRRFACQCRRTISCYDATLQLLVDKHAPMVKVTSRFNPRAPWYDAGSRAVTTETRRLERLHRRFQTSVTLGAWKDKSYFLRSYLQEQYRDYWTRTITDNMSNSKRLWSKVNLLLQDMPASSEQTRLEEDFAVFP